MQTTREQIEAGESWLILLIILGAAAAAVFSTFGG